MSVCKDSRRWLWGDKFEGATGLDNDPRIGDNEFDFVVSHHVVEHVPYVIAFFVEELYRITKPGGKIRLPTPHYTNPD